jgi:hypothetical protein
LNRTQRVKVQVIDLLGEVEDFSAVEILLDQVMALEDERLLRRAVDMGLKPYLEDGSPLQQRSLAAVWQRIVEPGTLTRTQFLKRRWHLIHILETLKHTNPPSCLGGLPKVEQAACLMYLWHTQKTDSAMRQLCRVFAHTDRVDEEAQRRALNLMLDSEDFYLQRTAAHFLRVVSFDCYPECKRAIRDPSIEVRFSSLKSLLTVTQNFADRRYHVSAIHLLFEAIREHSGEREEHFRQVALGVIKEIDYVTFVPIAIQALDRESDIFKVDMINDLKHTTGFWREVTLNRLIGLCSKGSRPVQKASEYVYQLLV